mgnify:CR=1
LISTPNGNSITIWILNLQNLTVGKCGALSKFKKKI